MQTFQQYFYENKTILSHIMESRSGKWDIFIKFASSFEVLSFSIRFFAKFGRHFASYLFGKPLAYRKRAAGIVGDECRPNEIQIGEDGDGEDLTSILICFKGSGPPPDQAQLTLQLMTISPALYGVVCAVTILCIILAVCFLAFNIKLRNYR